MSPEQAAAERELDGRSDQYSLACVLYEMLAGQAPFNAPTAQAVVGPDPGGGSPAVGRAPAHVHVLGG